VYHHHHSELPGEAAVRWLGSTRGCWLCRCPHAQETSGRVQPAKPSWRRLPAQRVVGPSEVSWSPLPPRAWATPRVKKPRLPPGQQGGLGSLWSGAGTSLLDGEAGALPPSSCSPHAGAPVTCVSARQRLAVMLGIPRSSSSHGRSPPRASLSCFSGCPRSAFCSRRAALAGGQGCHLTESIAPPGRTPKPPRALLCSHPLFVPLSQQPAPDAEPPGSNFGDCWLKSGRKTAHLGAELWWVTSSVFAHSLLKQKNMI